jgi:hypothetical protein
MRSSIALFAAIPAIFALYACTETTIVTHTHGTAAAADQDGGDPTLDSDGGTVDTDSGTTSKDAGTKKDSGTTTQSTGEVPEPDVTYNGGNILDTPNIVTVTFDGDALRTTVENFGASITDTAWWDAVRDGYCDSRGKCIGRGTNGGTVHLPSNAAGGSYSDSAAGGASTMKTFIDGYVTNGTFPAPTTNTLYVIYFPNTTTISLDGTASCSTFGGYHNSMTSKGVTFAYAILPRCDQSTPTLTQQYLTFAASHELIEAATDPFLSGNPSNPYGAFGSFTDAWDVLSGGEVGDRCVDMFANGPLKGEDVYTESGYTVQRTFSNKSSKAGHNPCVPANVGEVYFNVAPRGGDVVNVAVGGTVSVAVDAFSDGPISTLSFGAQEVTADLQKGSNVLTVTADRATISSGETAFVTVKLNSSPSQGIAIVLLYAQAGNGTYHYWPLAVQPM